MKKSELELLHVLCKAANDHIPVAEFKCLSDELFSEKTKPFHQRTPKPNRLPKIKRAK